MGGAPAAAAVPGVSGQPAAAVTPQRRGSAGAAALLVVSEAAWVSLALGAFADGSAGPHRPRVDLPYLAFALPALVALVIVTVVRGRTPLARQTPLWRLARRSAVALVVVGGAGLSAGLVASLSAPGVTWAAALHPWALPAHGALAVRAVRWAWAVSVLAWLRGAWVAVSPPTLRHSAASLVLGGIVFVVVFGHQAAGGSGRFDQATSAAAWLLFVYFPVGVTAAAWAQERDVERQVLRRVAGASSGAWLATLVVPLALVALVALLVGGAGSVVGPGATHVLRAIGAVLGAAGDWVFSHLPRIVVHPGQHRAPITPGQTSLHRLPKRATSAHPTPLGIAVECVVGAALLAAAGFGARALVRWARRHRPEAVVDDERESVFTWSHLGEQLRRLLVVLLNAIARRPRRRPAPVLNEARDSTSDPLPGDPVRVSYRRLLLASRAAGRGRAPAETPRELAARLSSLPVMERLGSSALASLTAAYEDVRYAGAPSGPLAERATADADVLVDALGAIQREAAEPAQPEARPRLYLVRDPPS